jgi:Protein of unknown function (DUF3102)
MAARNGASHPQRGDAAGARKANAFGKRPSSSRTNNLPQVSCEEWTRRIKVAWAKGVSAFVETGRLLIEAKDALRHGAFIHMIECGELGFGASTAERLMKIARNKVLSDSAHAPNLPPNWTTLYELTKLPPQKLLTLIDNGSIRAGMDRQEAESLTALHVPKAKPIPHTIAVVAYESPPPRALPLDIEVNDIEPDDDHGRVRQFPSEVILHDLSPDKSLASSSPPAELEEIAAQATKIIEPPPDRFQILLASWNAAPDDVRRQFLDFIGLGIPDFLRRDRVQP